MNAPVFLSHRETDDAYCGVIARLGDGWRVIRCADNLQWIIQRRKSGAGGRWVNVSYHLSRAALIAAGTAYAGALDPFALARLARLPDHMGGAHGRA